VYESIAEFSAPLMYQWGGSLRANIFHAVSASLSLEKNQYPFSKIGLILPCVQ
jgi:hypothetical protein